MLLSAIVVVVGFFVSVTLLRGAKAKRPEEQPREAPASLTPAAEVS
jgi:hypothetical protein